MILRFRGKDGNYRIEASGAESFKTVVERLIKQLPEHRNLRLSSLPTVPGTGYAQDWEETLEQLKLQNGSMFFITYDDGLAPGGSSDSSLNALVVPSKLEVQSHLEFVDKELAKFDGKIMRKHSRMCKHGPKGMCEYCQPVEPYDDDYRMNQGIKHMSFHAYIRKLHANSSLEYVLETPDYTVKKNCKAGHAPWPNGICSNCQPAAISLQQQRFRLVDHVEFGNSSVINNFIDYWRNTTSQRLGFLMGYYERHDAVPLGIKAVVQAIWEPEQSDMPDGLIVEQLPTEAALKAAELLGLKVVGVIFTDLTDAGTGDGKVICKRHANSFFLSSLEVLFAARLQNKYFNWTTYSETGKFSSKFVTCIISGNLQGEIDVACYQVSVQGESLVNANLITASVNPSVMKVREPSRNLYVPDIFFKHPNEYNINVQENAKPAFPIDYLLVSISHGFPDSPSLLLNHEFPIENRSSIRAQTVTQIIDYLDIEAALNVAHLQDFHLLVYLMSLQVLSDEEVKLIGELVKAYRASPHGQAVRDNAKQLQDCPGIRNLLAMQQ